MAIRERGDKHEAIHYHALKLVYVLAINKRDFNALGCLSKVNFNKRKLSVLGCLSKVDSSKRNSRHLDHLINQQNPYQPLLRDSNVMQMLHFFSI